ncbi:polyamine deacetylase HDAC10 [Denticeps clupeoides]|uniref:Histone deacetylase domain-containing protein n=1 Tax=Denticeps clupeoides TaxID=299321 RepID=A0AAY4DWT8_9TELE|nr:polyamine deacetylase HDAC10 [Denticeps clupeoides]XP_028814188.1 polyamine deacetylase HDAC10 [Denticeps clupeoides]
MAARTALVYDEEMTRYKLLWVDPACKVEVPERLTVSYAALKARGLAARCVALPVRGATDEDVLLVHSEEYLEAVKQTPHMDLEGLMKFTQQYGDVYFHPNIYHCATLAIGATLQLVDSVMTGKVRNGMALVRPPGHHSQRSAANGFCVFNNVAIAALYAKKHYDVKRVLIVDWDIHHGQGVQYCFEEDPSVLYFSWHRYEHQSFWPNLQESDYDTVGKGKGLGFNINLPWNKVGMNNSDYLSAFFHVLLPVAYEFSPDLVFVSAGFDSAIGDPEGHMCATPDVFAHLTHLLMSLAGGKLCAVLEGGYNLTSLPQSVCQTVQTLLGDPTPEMSGLDRPCLSALESIQNVRAAHHQYWSCFRHTAVVPVREPSTKRCRSEGGEDGGEKREEGEAEDKPEDLVWPEPLSRPAPAVRTAVAFLPGVRSSVPQGCQRLEETSPASAAISEELRDQLAKDVKDEKILQCLTNVLSLLDKVEKKEVRNGLAVVSDVSLAATFALRHALSSTAHRVLLVLVGDAEPPADSGDGRVFLVQFCSKEPEGQKSLYYLPVCLKKGPAGRCGFVHAVLGLVLPLAYQYSPGLVLVALAEGSGVDVAAWAQLTSLLQGVAQGRMLTLMQGCEEDTLRATAASLMGEPTSALGPTGTLIPEDARVLERERKRLQGRWGLLQTAVAAQDKN